MPGIQNIVMGGLFLVVGLIITGATYAAASPGGTYVVTTGAIAVGAIQLVIGLGQAGFYAARGPEGRAKHHAQVGTRVIARCMISMTTVEGGLSRDEIAIIQLVARQALGGNLSEELIQQTYDQMIRGGSDISEELRDIWDQVTVDDADIAVKAAAMVALADNDLSQAEEERLIGYANALRLGNDRFQRCYSEAVGVIQRLLEPNPEEANSQVSLAKGAA